MPGRGGIARTAFKGGREAKDLGADRVPDEREERRREYRTWGDRNWKGGEKDREKERRENPIECGEDKFASPSPPRSRAAIMSTRLCYRLLLSSRTIVSVSTCRIFTVWDLGEGWRRGL